MARTQMQASSLTSLWFWTSHIPAPGLQRLDDISGYFGRKTKIKTKNPVTITLSPGHLNICGLGEILGSHQDLRCCFSPHFYLPCLMVSLRTSLLLLICLPHSLLTANSPIFSENGHWVRCPSMAKRDPGIAFQRKWFQTGPMIRTRK